MPPSVDPYGSLDLRRGDRDADGEHPPTWAGVQQDDAGDDAPGHVGQLQRDLDELGFHLVGHGDGDFGRTTEWAVREFQVYARLERVAHESDSSTVPRYVERLSAVSTEGDRYDGPVSGVVNAATRRALATWLERRWRCPVIVEAWNMSGGVRQGLRASNLWLHDDVPSNAPRMYVRDFSGYYDPPAGDGSGTDVVLGDFAKYLDWSGPRSVPPHHVLPEGELLPEAVLGREFDELSDAELSTYKTLRAVSEVECLGYLDSVNSYDNALVSLGPCHWTLGIVSGDTVSDGELCGFLAYLRHADREAYDRAFAFFGVDIAEDWVTASGEPTGGPLFDEDLRKYAGWVMQQQDDGTFERVPRDEEEANYFKTWHWFYRFVMAGRWIEGHRHRSWDMARVRLRDLLAAPWGDGVGDTGDPTRPPVVGDVFTSEQAAAILVRWHVRYPSHVVFRGDAGPNIREALEIARERDAGLDWPDDPARWTDQHERALIDGLLEAVAATGNDGLQSTIDQVVSWPSWADGANPYDYRLSPTIGGLASGRGSLDFDEEGLPPAP